MGRQASIWIVVFLVISAVVFCISYMLLNAVETKTLFKPNQGYKIKGIYILLSTVFAFIIGICLAELAIKIYEFSLISN